jgi:hypothetical protein
MPWEKFRGHSALVPSKISIANITRNFSQGKLVFYCGYSEASTKEKFLGNFPTYSWKNSDLFSEKFRPILGKIPRNFSMLTPRIFCFTGDGSSDIFMEKFRPILGKILRNFSMLIPRIFCFTGDGSSEELT